MDPVKACDSMTNEGQRLSDNIIFYDPNAYKQSKVTPQPDKRNILITSALPYVNNVPHLGNIVGCVLSADVYARFCRLRGHNTLYVCGTDEYGTATETKALEEGISCQDLCDRYHHLHANIYRWFNVSFDIFGRTTTPQQTEIAQDIFLKLHAQNMLLEDTMEQLYCEKCQRFLADRFVEGTCPKCGYHDARGDQCDSCGQLLNAAELVQPRCKLDRTPPVMRSSRHLFLDLPRLQSQCENFVDTSSKKGQWSDNGIAITQKWLREGLKPRCITRDLKWGTPVPLDSMKDKVFYVWFDAPIGYISITANYTDDWRAWWQSKRTTDQDKKTATASNPTSSPPVALVQFMGKDNVPFHTVIFPCSLMGTGEPYTLVHHVSTTEYLNYESGKFSKSRGVGVFGDQAQETGIPADVFRYYLLANRPETGDATFSWDDLRRRTNTELLNGFGNLCHRVLAFTSKVYGAALLPGVGETLQPRDNAFLQTIQTHLEEYTRLLEGVQLRAALECTMSLVRAGNEYLSGSDLTRQLFEVQRARCDTVIALSFNLLYLLAVMFHPFMPCTSEQLLRQLNAPMRQLPVTFTVDLLQGHAMGQPAHLFTRLDEKVIEGLQARFGGTAIDTKTNEKEDKKKKMKEDKKKVKEEKTGVKESNAVTVDGLTHTLNHSLNLQDKNDNVNEKTTTPQTVT